MRTLTTTTALLLCALPLSAQTSTSADEQQQDIAPEVPVALSLQDATSGFDGAFSLEDMRHFITDGAKVNETDSNGDTPLLYLCRAIEMDYRYNNDPHFAQALDEAIILMLRSGADIMHENKSGCNALFYLHSKPELMAKLKEAGLLPKPLSVRIPHDARPFLRYIKQRTSQAELTRHDASREYLISQYCAPAYDRAQERVTHMLSAAGARHRSYEDLCALLAFMRLADEEKAQQYILSFNYWEHGEHFLEEVPALMLKALAELEWDVAPQALRTALAKLDSMLPGSPDEMIDCDAAQPMGILLTMLMRTEGDRAEPLIRKYADCNEANLAYTAHRIMLQRQSLPAPEKDVFRQLYGNDPETMQLIHRRLYECALVDEALRNNDLRGLTSGVVERVIAAFRDMGLIKYADIVATLLKDGSLTDDRYPIQAAHHSYIEQPPPSPRIIMARYILAHPDEFPTSATEQP